MCNELKKLAEQYENADFLNGDPSWFMHQVCGNENQELMAFIASALSYGSRKQFLPKIQYVLDCSKGDLRHWLATGQYAADVPPSQDCYYRLFTYDTMCQFLRALAEMVEEYGSLGNFIRCGLQDAGSRSAYDAVRMLTEWFAEHGSVGVIPKNTASSCKRVCMFLRWMVRTDSPVDLGLWAEFIDRTTLIVPMDTHVVQEANRLGLISSRSTSMSAALKLTDKLREIFPDDPLKGDFALFGVGVDLKHSGSFRILKPMA